jgi:hypothetical protein
MDDGFCYKGERFADLQMLRYRLNGFEQLTINQKQLVYYLSEATLWGRDITFDQIILIKFITYEQLINTICHGRQETISRRKQLW